MKFCIRPQLETDEAEAVEVEHAAMLFACGGGGDPQAEIVHLLEQGRLAHIERPEGLAAQISSVVP